MRSTWISRSRRWIGASALAIIAGLSGGTAFVAATSQNAVAQATVQNVAQIVAPQVSEPVSFADLVDAVKPAVVSIIVEGNEQASNQVLRRGPGGGDGFSFEFPDLPDGHPFKDFFEQFGNGQGGNGGQTPRQRKFQAAGSGFAISADGYFVTNNHVVKDATKVTVVFDNGDEKAATIVGTDERTDLAVIKVDGLTDQPFVRLADTEARVGDWVMAVGNPFGLGGTVTVGIVSARGRDIGGSSYGDFLQIDAAVNTGNSGGPTFNLKGEVVGVNTAIFSPNGGNVGIAFAIPASTVKRITTDLMEHGTVTRGYLGVAIQDVSRDIADSVGLTSPKGALVTEPSDGGPAAKAGVNSGDIITAVDGDPIDNALDLSRTIASKIPGTTVELSVWRNGKEEKVSVKLETLKVDAAQAEPQNQQPPADPDQPVQSSVGITLVPNSDGQGLLIQDVDQESVAAEKGFAVGDAILEVDNKPVATAADFESAIQGVRDSGRNTALIKANRGGNIRFVGLPLGNP